MIVYKILLDKKDSRAVITKLNAAYNKLTKHADSGGLTHKMEIEDILRDIESVRGNLTKNQIE